MLPFLQLRKASAQHPIGSRQLGGCSKQGMRVSDSVKLCGRDVASKSKQAVTAVDIGRHGGMSSPGHQILQFLLDVLHCFFG